MVADSVAVTAIMTYLVSHQYFSQKRQSGFGSGNIYGAEVLCRDVLIFWPLDTGMFFTKARCNATVLQLN